MQIPHYKPIWSEKFVVRSFDIDLNGLMRMSSLCGYFQEVAGRHAEHLDVGYHFMQDSGRVWLLSRLFIKINKLPHWKQEIFLETWPLGTERIFYRRDYKVVDGNDTLVTATSYWILLDLKTRRPTIVSLDTEVLKTNAGRYSMPMPTEGFPNITGNTSETRQVKYSDLDQNRHVNNARYVEWIFDILDPDMVEKKSPAFFAIEYKHEVKAGDQVVLYRNSLKDELNTFFVEGLIAASDQVCMKSKIVF